MATSTARNIAACGGGCECSGLECGEEITHETLHIVQQTGMEYWSVDETLIKCVSSLIRPFVEDEYCNVGNDGFLDNSWNSLGLD